MGKMLPDIRRSLLHELSNDLGVVMALITIIERDAADGSTLKQDIAEIKTRAENAIDGFRRLRSAL